MTTPPQGTPAQFWSVSHAEPVIWFVGSFVSVWEPSALPSAHVLTSGVLAAIASGTEIDGMLVQAARRSWPTKWPRLESTLQELHYCVGDLAAEALAPLKGGTPNAYHRFIAAHLPRARKVYTTNQDELIEAALRAAGHVEGSHFVVWLPGEGEPDPSMMHVVKLHGTASDATSVRTTVRQVHGGLPDDMAQRLKADLSSHHFCVAGYSGNDIDIRPVFLAAVPRGVFWLDRDVNVFAADLAASGKRVLPTIADLSTFLSSSPPLIESRVAPTMPSSLAAIDPYLRACTVSRCIGLATPDDPELHRRAQAVARRLSHRHTQAWRVWYDIAERDVRDAGAFQSIRAFVHYLVGWRRTSGDARGELLCLRGMWMSCDLLFLGVFGWTYRIGLVFAGPARRAAARMAVDERDYGAALVDLFELRGFLRSGQVERAFAIAKRLAQMRSVGAHLRGHGLRFLAQCQAMSDDSSGVEELLGTACEEFDYIESPRDVRNVHRTGVICAIWRRDLVSARRHLAEAVHIHADRRERARLMFLRGAIAAAAAGWWRVARRLAAYG